MRAPLARVEVSGPAVLVEAARLAEEDLRAVGNVVGELLFTPRDDASEISVEAELAPTED